MWPKREKSRAWTIAERCGCLVVCVIVGAIDVISRHSIHEHCYHIVYTGTTADSLLVLASDYNVPSKQPSCVAVHLP